MDPLHQDEVQRNFALGRFPCGEIGERGSGSTVWAEKVNVAKTYFIQAAAAGYYGTGWAEKVAGPAGMLFEMVIDQLDKDYDSAEELMGEMYTVVFAGYALNLSNSRSRDNIKKILYCVKEIMFATPPIVSSNQFRISPALATLYSIKEHVSNDPHRNFLGDQIKHLSRFPGVFNTLVSNMIPGASEFILLHLMRNSTILAKIDSPKIVKCLVDDMLREEQKVSCSSLMLLCVLTTQSGCAELIKIRDLFALRQRNSGRYGKLFDTLVAMLIYNKCYVDVDSITTPEVKQILDFCEDILHDWTVKQQGGEILGWILDSVHSLMKSTALRSVCEYLIEGKSRFSIPIEDSYIHGSSDFNEVGDLDAEPVKTTLEEKVLPLRFMVGVLPDSIPENFDYTDCTASLPCIPEYIGLTPGALCRMSIKVHVLSLLIRDSWRAAASVVFSDETQSYMFCRHIYGDRAQDDDLLAKLLSA